jgi:hypothetical protein
VQEWLLFQDLGTLMSVAKADGRLDGIHKTNAASSSANQIRPRARMSNDCAAVENDAYLICVDRLGEIDFLNKLSDARYRVPPDVHEDIDRVRGFDFWGTTTFWLNGGTKLAIDSGSAHTDSGNRRVRPNVTVVDSANNYAVRVGWFGLADELDVREMSYMKWLSMRVVETRAGEGDFAVAGFVSVSDEGDVLEVDQHWMSRSDGRGNQLTEPKLESRISRMMEDFARFVNVRSGILAIEFCGVMQCRSAPGVAERDPRNAAQKGWRLSKRAMDGALLPRRYGRFDFAIARRDVFVGP